MGIRGCAPFPDSLGANTADPQAPRHAVVRGAVGQLDPRARRTASVLNAWAYRRRLIVDIAASSFTIVPLNWDVCGIGGISAASETDWHRHCCHYYLD
jgi:hypothetical protein